MKEIVLTHHPATPENSCNVNKFENLNVTNIGNQLLATIMTIVFKSFLNRYQTEKNIFAIE